MFYQGKRVSRASKWWASSMIVSIAIMYCLTAAALAVSYIKEETKEEEIPVVRAEEITTPVLESAEVLAMTALIEEEQKQKEEMFSESLVMYQAAKPTEESYIIQSNDTLWKIAINFYGEGSFYPYIMETNELTSTNVREGQTLTIKYIEDSERKEILDECLTKIKELESAKKSSSTGFKDTGIPEGAEYVSTFRVTGYDPYCVHCCGKDDGITASGKKATFGHTIAADRSRFPFGTKLYIEGLGTFTVEDVGGAIKGNKIDVAVDGHDEAYKITGNYNVYIIQ